MKKSLLAFGITFLVSSALVHAQSNSEDCRKKDQLKKQILALVSQEQEVIDKGKKEKAECDNEVNPSKREKCMEKNVNPLRDKLKQIRGEREGLKPDVERFDALCPDAGLQNTKEMFEKIAKENCNPKGNQDRCEDGLFQLADLGYKDDARTNMGNQARYERDYEKWVEADRKGKEPRLTPPSYDLSVKTHKEYLAQMKTGRRRDLILYRLAFIYDLIGTPEQAFPLMMELVKNFPNSKHRGPANLRIGEYYFVQRNYDSAITYYNRVETKDGPAVEDNVLGLALYHKAEALYQKGRYDEAINAFFDYVDRADKGQIRRADLRQEAILYMGSSFAEFEDSYQKATAFFKKVGSRSYEDTLLFEMGKKHEDRDQFDRCILTYEQFLKRYPYFAKAPLAQIGLIQVYVKQKKIEEAQVERDKLVKNYVKGASWWDKVGKMDPKDKETVSIAVRDAMLESAVSDHFPGKERNDTARVRRSVAGYKRFMDAYKAEGGWPVYRANIYLADAQSWLGNHVDAADIYEWAAKQDVSKYGIPTRGEQNITQPADAGYNAVVELTQAADQEIQKAGGDKKKAYQSPVAQRYMKSVNDYISRFPKAPEVDNLSYNLVVYQYGGEDFTSAIVSAERLVKMFPAYKFMRETRRMLAQSYIEAGRFTDGEKEYRTVLSSTPANDSSFQDMTDAVAVSIFKQGEKAEKEGKIEEAVAQFRRVKKDMPKSAIADESAYRAGIVYEKAKMYAKAAKEFNDFSLANPTSKFAIEAVQRSAVNSVDGKDSATAIATYLSITDRFPKDSAGFNGIAIAASLYDSSGKDIQKAQTLEKYLAKYPEDTRTPGFLYTAGLTYEKAKDYQNAIRVYQIVFTKYPTNQYSPEAAFSIPIIQEKLGNKLEMAKAYEDFATKYVNDKSKVAKAYLRAAMVYHEQKNMAKANELFLKVTKFYVEKDNAVAIDASIPAQAFFYMGEIEAEKANALAIGGTTDVKKIAEQIKARKEALKLAAAHYNNAIKLQIEEWALKSAIAMADQQFKVATDVADIKPPQGENLKAIQERILFSVALAKTTPKLSSDAAEMYAALIKLANAANVSNKITKEAGRRLLRTYLMQGQAMEGIGNAIASEPCPSKQAQGSDAYVEECEFHKAQKEDNQINFQKKAVEIGYAKGIEVAKEYQVVGPEYDTLRARVKFIEPENPSLQVVVEEKKVEPKKFVDADFQRNMARIAEIASSGMESEERVRLLKSMKIEGERLEQELRTEVESLRAQLTQAPKGK